MQSAGLIAQADQAAATGNLKEAERLLAQAAGSTTDFGLLLKLASLQRANGRPESALESVQRALAISPRDFTALLMKASLLDRLDNPIAGQAWTHAIAQRPDGELPPPIVAALEQGERRAQEWFAARSAKFEAAMSKVESRADPDERERMVRFRANALRETRPYHSEPTDFHYPGLREREFHPRSLFPWIEELESATEEIVAELKAVMSAERAELVPYVQYEDHLPLDQWKPLNKSLDWTAIHLLQNGSAVEANARHCPKTMEILRSVPQPQIPGASPNAMFSLLAPKTRIPPHHGVNNARLVCHLPLVVPEGCWFRVGAETRYWKTGEVLVFDDTIEHEAMNPTADLRVVLIFDTWHPDLTPVERDAVAALIGVERPSSGL
jgi:hypothetical protein